MNSRNKHIFFWIVSIAATLFFSFPTFLSFSEWWKVTITKDVSSYPWGHINDNPWYYENADIYSKVMLTEGFVMLSAVIITIWFQTQRQKANTLYSLLTCLGLFVLIVLNGHI